MKIVDRDEQTHVKLYITLFAEVQSSALQLIHKGRTVIFLNFGFRNTYIFVLLFVPRGIGIKYLGYSVLFNSKHFIALLK